MRALAFALLVALLAGCAGTNPLGVGDVDLATPESLIGNTEPPPGYSDVPFKSLTGMVEDHLADCGRGLDFTIRTFTRQTGESWARTVAFFQ
jgi:hypothetical protein